MEKKNLQSNSRSGKMLGTILKTVQLIRKFENKNLSIVFCLGIIFAVFPILSVYFSQELINTILSASNYEKVGRVLFMYIGISVVAEIISQVQVVYEQKLQINLSYKLNKEIMKKCGDMSLENFENAETYNQLERINREVTFKPYQTFTVILSMAVSIITLISSFVYLSAWDIRMASLLLLVPFISVFYYIKIGQKEFDIQVKRTSDERKAWYFNYILTHDFSFKEIKFLDLKDYIIEGYSHLKEKFINEDLKMTNKKAIFSMIFEMFVQLVGFLVLTFAVMAAYAGKIFIGNIVGYIKAISMIQSNSKGIMTNMYALYNNNLYMNQLFDFLDGEISEQVDQRGKEIKLDNIEQITVKDLNFTYTGSKIKNLNQISLHFNKGEKIAVVGPNGSGKSTLIKLIAGLYEKDSGEILIDGMNLDTITKESYKNQVSILFQDFMKYELSVKENIGFGRIENIEDLKGIKQAIKELDIGFIGEDLNQRLGLWFEEGRQLSGGQWQKVALARTFFREASIYILDEPSSALDPIAEKNLFKSFFDKVRNKIGVFISHSIEAAKQADKIIVMSDGEVVGCGTHEELKNTCKVYRDMEEAERYEYGEKSVA